MNFSLDFEGLSKNKSVFFLFPCVPYSFSKFQLAIIDDVAKLGNYGYFHFPVPTLRK